jgi:hypothetical protein
MFKCKPFKGVRFGDLEAGDVFRVIDAEKPYVCMKLSGESTEMLMLESGYDSDIPFHEYGALRAEREVQFLGSWEWVSDDAE